MADTKDNVKFQYGALSNIAFKGEIDSGISREEWSDMSDKEKKEAVTEALFELVDIGPDED